MTEARGGSELGLGELSPSDVHCFTSFSFSYLNRARVLARSVRTHSPNWKIWALIVDEPPAGFEFELTEEDFDFVCRADELEISDFRSWVFRHNVIEACTAVKGPFARKLLEAGATKVVYLDPDVAVFSSLSPIEEMLEQHDMLLTPHQLAPDESRQGIIDNEICSLKHGSFNLGFFALSGRGDGPRFARWWSERLLDYCRDDIPNGLFTDQKWCDLVPCFFSGVYIVRDAGFNVASWNLSQRRVEINATGDILVNGSKLRFFHFTKLGPVGDAMTERYALDNTEVFELWAWYAGQVKLATSDAIPSDWWAYGCYADGQPIRREERALYAARADLRRAFRDPFASGPTTFQEWYRAHGAPVHSP